MKRIVFLDYVRVFACFLVILVHASENFYGAAGSTDMVGPQSYLARPAMGSSLRRFLTHGSTTIHDCFRLPPCTDEKRTDHMAILPPALLTHPATIFYFHDTL